MRPDNMPINTMRDDPAPEQLNKTTSVWNIELNTRCPNCYSFLNLMDEQYMMEEYEISVAEHDTPQSTDMIVCCGECGEDFSTTLVY